MCSLFGYVAKAGKTVDREIIAQIVAANIHRGPHAFGFAWINQAGRLRSWKAPGNALNMIGVLKMASDAVMMIGHLRYVTHGSAQYNINNHPHACDGGWIVHNGVVHNNRELISDHRLMPVSNCDSEVIGLMAERSSGTTAMDRLLCAVEHVEESPLAVLGLWNRKRQLVAIRRGNPLHLGETETGYYLGSVYAGLPGDVRTVKDRAGLRFTQRGISIDIQMDNVGDCPPSRPRPARKSVTVSTNDPRRDSDKKPAKPAAESKNYTKTFLERLEDERRLESVASKPADKLPDDDKWWHNKPGSRIKGALPYNDKSGRTAGVNEDGTIDPETYRGG